MTPEEALEKVYDVPYGRGDLLKVFEAIATTAEHGGLIKVAEKWEEKGQPLQEDIRFTYYEFARKLRNLAEEGQVMNSQTGITVDELDRLFALTMESFPWDSAKKFCEHFGLQQEYGILEKAYRDLESLRRLDEAQEQAERKVGRYIKAQAIKGLRKDGVDTATIRAIAWHRYGPGRRRR